MIRLSVALRRAVRRSRKLEQFLVLLWRRGRVDRVEAAATLRMQPRRLAAMLDGRPPYRSEHSVIDLGVVRRVRGEWGPAFELTEEGVAQVALVLELCGAEIAT